MHECEHRRWVPQFCFRPLLFPLPATVFGLLMLYFAFIGFPVSAPSLAAFFIGAQGPAYKTAVSLPPVTAAAEIKIPLTILAADTNKRCLHVRTSDLGGLLRQDKPDTFEACHGSAVLPSRPKPLKMVLL